MYTFVPNENCRMLFNTLAPIYQGNALTPLIQTAIGHDNYKKQMIAQDPFAAGRIMNTIFARRADTSVCIGIVHKWVCK